MEREAVVKDKRHERELDQRIAELVDEVRSLQGRTMVLINKVYELKKELRVLLEERGSNWEDDEGYARLISDGVRVTYDTKALDELIIKDPLHCGWLKDYRKETPFHGSVQVK